MRVVNLTIKMIIRKTLNKILYLIILFQLNAKQATEDRVCVFFRRRPKEDR